MTIRFSLYSFLFLFLIAGLGNYSTPFCVAEESSDTEMAQYLAAMSETPKGICAVLGDEDGSLGLALAQTKDYQVHVLTQNADTAKMLQQQADAEGIYGKHIVIEPYSYLEGLPFAENTIDWIVSTQLTDSLLSSSFLTDALRSLRPRGHAILGVRSDSSSSLKPQHIKQALKEAGIEQYSVFKDTHGLWAKITKPDLEGIDEWTHWEHGPDNNPVSTDQVIKAPYRTQWLGMPYYIAMPAISTAAGGRIFIAMGHIAHHKREEPWLNLLIAHNGYNGTELWRRRLPDGYLAHRSAFVATDEIFYMIDTDGNGIVMIDAKTGVDRGRIDIPEIEGEWKWIAMQDGILYALSGIQKDPPETTIVRSQYTHWSWGELSRGYYQPRVPWGFGETILAYDLQNDKVLWTHKEDKPVDSRAMALGDGKLYFYGPDSHLGCLDGKTGEVDWTNNDSETMRLIEEPGRGLISTPGFRTMCYCLYTPDAIFYEAQTRMNIVAVSKKDGSRLWHQKKTSNNPNMIYLDGKLLVGIGAEGKTLVLEPLTGEIIEDLGFKKRSCARLTATPDSFFCRGWPEGLTRYDREEKKFLFNGAFRPSCNDGVIGANGLLYMGPWACDCNLSLMGRVSLCSAGDFQVQLKTEEKDHLYTTREDLSTVEELSLSDNDWNTYRGNNDRTASTNVSVSGKTSKIWEFKPNAAFKPTTPVAAGGIVFVCGDDGVVRALDAANGQPKWNFMTAGPILQPPTIWEGRAYVGSGDGYIYALEAATGELLWRFRAAPSERRIPVYGSLCSTWPVNSGVIVKNGVVYAAAGIIDYDGTYVYALDAVTGKIKWRNDTSGHLDPELRKGISAQGILTIANGRLWMPGGNVVSPAAYDLETGEYCADSPGDGSPKANRGEEIAVFNNQYVMLGGRLRYSAAENVVNPGSFELFNTDNEIKGRGLMLQEGKIPPAWNQDKLVMVDGRYNIPACFSVSDIETFLQKGDSKKKPKPLWASEALDRRDIISLILTENAVLAVCETPRPRNLYPVWTLCALNPENGSMMWHHNLPSEGLTGGLMVDRDGRVIGSLLDGGVVCYGGEKVLQSYVHSLKKLANAGVTSKKKR